MSFILRRKRNTSIIYRALPCAQTIGTAPLRVSFSSEGSFDFDKEDDVSFRWLFDGKTAASSEANPTFTYQRNGVYHAILQVTNKNGASAQDTIEIKVGNSLPRVTIDVKENKTFYWDHLPVTYAVTIADDEERADKSKGFKSLL
jgi:cytochrome c